MAYIWLVLFVVLGFIWSALQPFIYVVSALCALFGKGKVKQWGINCWEGADNQLSAQLGGDPDETLSSRLGKAREKGSGWSIVANGLDKVALEVFNDPNHCQKSIERDEGRKQLTRY